MSCNFDSSQITIACRTFSQAEKMAGQYFRLNSGEWKAHRYDVKTLAYLDQHAVRKGAFAHLCKYEFEKEPEPDGRRIHFYRICLQDDRILDAVERA